MPETQYFIQWPIPEDQLLPLKDSVNGYLKSTSISYIPEFEYFMGIYPNGKNDDNRGETCIFLCLKFKNVKKVETDITFTIESAIYSHTFNYVYEKSYCWGQIVCKTNEFFDPENKFMVNGKFTIKVNGIFKYEIENDAIQEYKWAGGELGDELWENGEIKDYTIICEGEKQIKVHKFILLSRSDFFKEMLNSCSTDSSVEITDFSFKVVKTALKIIYNCNFSTFLSIDELMELLQFFDKYLFSTFKANVEQYLIAQISASTVCRLTNCSVKTNSSKLKDKCMEYLMALFQSKTALADIEILDKNILLEIVKNFLNENDAIPATIEDRQQKWIGGELADQLWENNDSKDFTILVGRKEIKLHKLVVETRAPMLNEKFEMKEANEIKIDNYSFDVVETAIKIIYHCNFITSLRLIELRELHRFFYDYNLTLLNEKVEPYLIAQISADTVVILLKCSIETDSFKLKEKCMDFLAAAFESKTPFDDIDILDDDVKSKLLKDSVYRTLETEK